MYRLLSAVLVLQLAAAPGSAQTAQALDLVPDDALGFIVVNDLRQLSDHVENLARKLKVKEHVSLLDLIQKSMGIREGLNPKGSALFIVFKAKSKKSPVEVVIAVPTTDYPTLAQQLGVKNPRKRISEGKMGTTSSVLAGVGGPEERKRKTKKEPVLVASKGNFALLTDPKFRDALERVLDSSKSITPALAPARTWLAKQDIAGVCTHRGVQVGLAMLLAGPGGIAGSSTQGQYARMKETFDELEKMCGSSPLPAALKRPAMPAS